VETFRGYTPSNFHLPDVNRKYHLHGISKKETVTQLKRSIHPFSSKHSYFQPFTPWIALSTVTTDSGSRCEFAIVVRVITRSTIFRGIAHEYVYIRRDVRRHFPPAFDMLSCAQ